MTAQTPFISPALEAEIETILADASHDLRALLQEALTARAERDSMPDTKTFTLRTPVSVGEVQYTEITLREPTSGELEKMEKSGEFGITGINLVGAIPLTAVRQIRARDYNAMRDYLLFFQHA